MKKKVLLIGGAGFIGLRIANFLAANRDYEIHIIDNFFRGKLDDDFKSFINEFNIKIINADFTNPKSRPNVPSVNKPTKTFSMLASIRFCI